MHKQRLAVIVAAAIGVVAFFLPWVSFAFGSFGMSFNGSDAGGWIPLVLAGAAGVFAFLGDDRNTPIEASYVKLVAGFGGGVTLFMIWKLFINIGMSMSGIGVWLMLIAGVGILAVPFVIKDSGDFAMPTKDSIKDEFNEMKDN